jgi:hypothetical protein
MGPWGAGEALTDDRREDEGERYESRFANDCSVSEGGDGERESMETSESETSDEGTELSGELGSLFSV